MKNLTDYIFYESWQLQALNIAPGEAYAVLADVGDLKKGTIVKFAGFQDVDNHYGIFVFTGADGKVLEVAGDCAGADHPCLRDLKAALSQSVSPGA